jgi:ParB family chromosome partitioning protein
MTSSGAPTVEFIPLDLISVVNPRIRNKKIFREIVSNIAEIGLKKPITVARHDHPEGPRYDLVCGQGRLEAFRLLGQREIPAIVVDAQRDDCMIMSLVENLARRQHRALDLLRDIQGLKRRGYSEPEIAQKTGLSIEYVRGVTRLLEHGEQRLLRGVESGHIPLSIAVEIADSDDAQVQRALQQAYESKQLRGRRLLAAKRLIEQRRKRGKGLRNPSSRKEPVLTSDALIRTYQETADKKRILVRKAEVTRERLVFIIEALRTLLADENFKTLLRAEGLETLPRNLADRMQVQEPV